MKRIITILLAVLLIIPFFAGSVQGSTAVSVVVKPALRNSLAEYDISFITDEDLAGGKDIIFIQFPEGTKLPCSCPHNWTLDHFSINGYKAARAGKVNDIPNTIYLLMPGGITIKAGSKINVVIKNNTNIWNPSKPGKYQLTVWTTKQGKMQSNEYEIKSTKIKDLSVSVYPETTSLIASYEIVFTTGALGELHNGENIYVEFPEGTVFPDVIHKKDITVNGFGTEDVSIEEDILKIKISHTINANRKVDININGDFNLQNTKEAGTHTLFVWTDNEPEKVGTEFTLKAQDSVTTQCVVDPSAPDGLNGYYKTSPIVTLTAETNTKEATHTFYKLDNGDYTEYKNPVTIPEGTHTFYYYSKTKSLTEKEKSIEFKVDTIAPTINIEFPEDNPSYTGDRSIRIYGSLSESAQLYIAHKYINVKKDLTFSEEILLTPGKNSIVISAIDNAGNRAEKTIEIVFDTTVPTLNITSPESWDTITTKQITVTGGVNPSNSEVTINGEKIVVKEDGTFAYSFVPESKGNLIPIKIKAVYPLSKKEVTKVITVVYKPNLPEVLLTVNSRSALVNGKKKEMDVAPFIDKHSNRTLVPVRFVTEFLGGKVSWGAKTKTVTIQLNGKEVKLKIGSNTAYVDGTAVTLDQPPIIKGNRTFVPLRFVMETFGFNVVWNASLKTITIISP